MLPAAASTAIVRGRTGTPPADCLFASKRPRYGGGFAVANLITRAFVGTGNNVVLAGVRLVTTPVTTGWWFAVSTILAPRHRQSVG